MTAQVFLFPQPALGCSPPPQGPAGGGVQQLRLPVLRAATECCPAACDDAAGVVRAGSWLRFAIMDVVPMPDWLLMERPFHAHIDAMPGLMVSCGAAGSDSARRWHGAGFAGDVRQLVVWIP